jgi:predicted alpha/beta superfamily hydrolase
MRPTRLAFLPLLGTLWGLVPQTWAQGGTTIFQFPALTADTEAVFVVGDLPELGNGDVRSALKLEPSLAPLWRLPVALPPGRTFNFRYVIRSIVPGRLGDPGNARELSGSYVASTPGAPELGASKVIMARSNLDAPRLRWRRPGEETFQSLAMSKFTQGTSANQNLWVTLGAGLPNESIEFYLESNNPPSRQPASGTISTDLPALLLQGDQLFTYVPAETVSPARRDYDPASPPTFTSERIPGPRAYRVVLPRGYDSHPDRRYPVVFFQDGADVLDNVTPTAWNALDALLADVELGRQRECIYVGVDPGLRRLSEYTPPESAGMGDQYLLMLREELLPIIERRYRTLPGRQCIGSIGSSAGGQIAVYMGYRDPRVFSRVGSLSGAWTTFNSAFYNQMLNTPAPPIRVYLDSGDAGNDNDNFALTAKLRDTLIAKGGNTLLAERDVKWLVGFGQGHDAGAWRSRLPGALRFLYPAREDLTDLRRTLRQRFDRDTDSRFTVEDLIVQIMQPQDLNFDGFVNIADTRLIELFLRRDEVSSMIGTAR